MSLLFHALTIVSSLAGQQDPAGAVLDFYDQADVVALGENHGHAEFHDCVFELLRDPPVWGAPAHPDLFRPVPASAVATLRNADGYRRSQILRGQRVDPALRSSAGFEAGQTPRLLELPPGTRLRVHRAGDGVIDGRLSRATAHEVWLQAEPNSGEPLAISLTTVTSVEMRARSTRRGAQILGVAGAVFGGLAGAVLSDLCDTGTCDGRGKAIFTVAAVGGASGGLLGAIIGAAIPRWERVWP